MSLVTEVTAFFSNQHLVSLTNPDVTAPSGGTVDSARLQKACDYVQALVEVHAGIAYDSADNRHNAEAVMCVQDILRVMGGQVNMADALDACKTRLKDLALVTGRNRIVPQGNSTLQPSTDTQAGFGSPPRPWSDGDSFRDQTLNGPGGQNNSGDDFNDNP
jgi:hypothetical protein